MSVSNSANKSGARDITPPSQPLPGVFALLSETDYLFFWVVRFSSILGIQVQSIALGWQVYETARLTRSVAESAFMVGMLGLAAFAPIVLLTLPAGEAADRLNRKTLMGSVFIGQAVLSLMLAVSSMKGLTSISVLLAASVVFGSLRSYSNPASQALGPMMVPRALLSRSVAWNSLAVQVARTAGPAIGGVLVAISPADAYWVTLMLYAVALASLARIRKSGAPQANSGSRWALMREGMAFVRNHRLVLGAISLDLFAVLLGGATALLPVFARDVLHIGAEGFGWLRAAPAIGAVFVGLAMTVWPIQRNAGLWMFCGVTVFGAATLLFSLSMNLWLSIAALAVVGGADMLSVFVRMSLVQLATPDALRGRVSAVTSLFIGASNELGEFESGVAARIFGAVLSTTLGGGAAMGVAGLWAWLYPELRRADKLH